MDLNAAWDIGPYKIKNIPTINRASNKEYNSFFAVFVITVEDNVFPMI